jgi:hypothetical protein
MNSTRSDAPTGPDDWPTEGVLFGNRPPIRSHRRPEDRRRGRPLRVVVGGAVAGTMAWSATAWGVTLPSHGGGTAAVRDPATLDTAVATTHPTPEPTGGEAAPTVVPTVTRPAGGPPVAGPVPPPAAAPVRPRHTGGEAAHATAGPRRPRGGTVTRPGASGAPAAPAGQRSAPAVTPPSRTPAPAATPASPAVVAPADGSTVRLMNATSGQFVGVRDGSTSNGAGIVQLTTTGEVTRWKLVATSGGCYQLVNLRSGKALDNPDGGYRDGSPMQQWERELGNPNQGWCFRSVGAKRYSVRNAASGSLLDLRDGRLGNGVPIQQWSADPADPNSQQTWQLVRVG